MWDVKPYTTISFCFLHSWFYLNYVGCKVQILNPVLEVLPKFYLNYVGCKEVISAHLLWFLRKFYLNYVGCKGVNGFILEIN